MEATGETCLTQPGWLLLLLALCWPAAAPANHEPVVAPADRPLLFGVFPYLSAVRLESIYAPVSQRLGQAIGQPVYFRTASQFKRFFAKLQQQHFDIALIQPFWYVPAVDRFGYVAIARMNEPFTSLIMVRDDSPLRRVEDLTGKVVATPPAFVPVVHMARKALREQGLEPGRDLELRAFKSVDSCFQQVLIGTADACVSPPFAPPVIEQKMKIKLRALLETPAIPNLTLVVHQRVPAALRARLRDEVLHWHRTADSQALLRGMKTRKFVAAPAADYVPVRALVKEAQP